MEKFNRVFQRHHVNFAGLVDFVEQRRECCRLAAAGAASDEHETGFFFDDLVEHRGELQFFH